MTETPTQLKPWMPLLCVLPLVACGLGLYWNWPWLQAEHQRLEPWKLPIIWLSEMTAAFWYVQTFLAYFLSSEYPEVADEPVEPRNRQFWLVVLSFLFSIIGDIAISSSTQFVEQAAYETALPVNGQVIEADVRQLNNGGTLYTLECRFQDAGGIAHDVTLFATQATIPGNVRQAVAAGQLPAPIDLKYDPSWPGRCWIADSPDPHHNRLYFMSYSTILFSGLLALSIVALQREWARWRLPSVKICPFLGVTLVLFLSGIGKLILGEA